MGDRLRYRSTKDLLLETAELLIDLHDPFADDAEQMRRTRRLLRLLKVLNARADLDLDDALHSPECVCEACWADSVRDPLT